MAWAHAVEIWKQSEEGMAKRAVAMEGDMAIATTYEWIKNVQPGEYEIRFKNACGHGVI